MFCEVHIAEAVYDEVAEKGRGRPGSQETEAAAWIDVHKVSNGPRALRMCNDYAVALGEAETIVLADELGADVALIDERRARIVASALGLNLVGTLGLLERAYEKGLVLDIRSAYADLRKAGVRIGNQLIEDSLKKLGLLGPADAQCG